ncbi:MAG: hypothetical protein QNJ97_23105 [Myxococcota bacterium]|nr:hypothetical protein [Myxococcota bacterium]
MTPRPRRKYGLYTGIALLVLIRGYVAMASETQTPPVILFLVNDTEQHQAFVRTEADFVAELGLSLDKCRLERIALKKNALAKRSLTDQIAIIEKIALSKGALATIWLERRENGDLNLQVVGIGTNRSVIHTMTAPDGEGAIERLALAVRVLMEETQMLPEATDESPTSKKEPVSSPVATDEPDVLPTRPAIPVCPEAVRPPARWGMVTGVRMGGGIAGQQGPSINAGATFALQRTAAPGILIRGAISGLMGPKKMTEEGALSGWQVGFAVDVGYWLGSHALSIGPMIRGEVLGSAVDAAYGFGNSQRFTWWGFSLGVGGSFQLSLTDGLAIALDVMSAGHFNRRTFTKRSDDSVILQTPRIALSGALGIHLSIW